jgi:hypothetical protein
MIVTNYSRLIVVVDHITLHNGCSCEIKINSILFNSSGVNIGYMKYSAHNDGFIVDSVSYDKRSCVENEPDVDYEDKYFTKDGVTRRLHYTSLPKGSMVSFIINPDGDYHVEGDVPSTNIVSTKVIVQKYATSVGWMYIVFAIIAMIIAAVIIAAVYKYESND